MKLWVRGFLFLVFHHNKTDDKNKFFSITTSTLRKGGFFSELVKSKSCGKCCLIIIRVEKIQLCWPFPWGCKLMITKLKLLTTLHWTTVFSFFHVNWCSTVGKYLFIVLRIFIHSLILLFKINPISFKIGVWLVLA